MVKHVFVRFVGPDALAIFGWPVFVPGVVLALPMWAKLILLSAARVLPWTFGMKHDRPEVLAGYVDVVELTELDRLLKDVA